MARKAAARKSRRRETQKPSAEMPLKLHAGVAGFESLQTADFLRFAALLVATALAYWPALRGGLIWDDAAHITRPELRTFAGLGRIWSELGATQQYYPLLHSAFWLEHRTWGGAVLGYHLANVILHCLAAFLLVLVVRRMTLPGAWLAGFLFALHPVCVNSVAWISEQKSTLSAVFYLASALAYLSFDKTRRRSYYLLASALFLLALLSKTVTATLPSALLVVLWWQRGRLDWKHDILPLAPWLATGASAGLFTAWVERRFIGAEGTDFALTFLDRCLLAARVFWFYLAKLAWPSNLMFIYPHWNIDSSVWWQYLWLLGMLALAAALCFESRRHRGPLAAFLYFTGTLVPVLGFLNVYPFIYSYVADHFQYLATLGVFVPLAVTLTRAAQRLSDRWRHAASALGVALLAALGALTWHQASTYRDSETIYRDTLRRNPASWMAHNNLGAELLDTPGHAEEALVHLQTALELKPDSAEAHNNRGKALEQIPGRKREAIAEYQNALLLRPKFPEAENNLGRVLSETGAPDAIPHFEAALRMRPNYADAHSNLGVALMKVPGRQAQAAAEFEQALEINPDLEQARNGLGSALSEQPGHVEDAIREFEAAIRVHPDYAEAHSNLGQALAQSPDRLPDAVKEYETALKIRPEYAEAHNGLGVALAKMGRMADALVQYEAALKLQPDYAEAHNNLGTALAQIPGRLPEAIPHFEAALASHPDSAEMHANLGNAYLQIPGRLPDAIRQLEAAVRLRPDFAEAHYLLGMALARMPGRANDARKEVQEAQRLRPDLKREQSADRSRPASAPR